MTKKKRLTRDIIIQTLVDALELLDYTHAFWEGGAAAFDRIDEWSDIDLYLVVDNKKVNETFFTVEKALKSLSSITQKYEVSHPPSSGLFQAFYKLDDASKYLIIDLAVLKLSSPDKFLEPEIHGNVVFYFNKSNKVKPPSLNKNVLAKKLQKRLKRLQARFDMFSNFVQKEINRGNQIEAIDLYHGLTLATLVEALRVKYNPVHHSFKTRYIHYELPSETIKRLEHLYFVRDEKDLQEKYHKAIRWFHEIMSEIDQKEIERRIRTSKGLAST
ncbi:MAG: nucleotidyltransferase domain-containing protein [Candidatus Bathyarchaeota archaeon]|nr:nucleotidyltransferase domain-containing protein [Candidatus Bathyarchaeota archaeon]MDH5495519.1 nucleotidyltransferase domain-containing protein [Candidatus Bathyarchaeota archaeon]